MTTLIEIARRFEGVKEVAGAVDNPAIMAMLRLDVKWPRGDEVPWCSAFVNAVAHLAGRERTGTANPHMALRARWWLRAGCPIGMGDELLEHAEISDNCVVVLQRGGGGQPGSETVDAPGHVGVYVDTTDRHVRVLGGNQSNRVKVSSYPLGRVLGVRYLPPVTA